MKEEVSLKDVVRKHGTFVCSDKVKSAPVVSGSAELRVGLEDSVGILIFGFWNLVRLK